ncbi:hypothetical protein [Tautonia plasticadhaerens]|uniref:Uncharacterized protein n=1 Tax=Tautonia plasticadhaerens TaxID=2527974 RepID=A0A518H2I2_9BACT|nr:hypothetical protein [Tautonia plasticadhaerens]QDV35017.1 hypothetical protein ElP_29140 [Tautonia plasticadhaerens]
MRSTSLRSLARRAAFAAVAATFIVTLPIGCSSEPVADAPAPAPSGPAEGEGAAQREVLEAGER